MCVWLFSLVLEYPHSKWSFTAVHRVRLCRFTTATAMIDLVFDLVRVTKRTTQGLFLSLASAASHSELEK